MTTRSGVLVGGLLSGPRYVNETTPPRQATGAGAIYLDALARNTGTASVTLADATLAGTGALRIAGTLSQTLADVTASATGILPIAGTDSSTLDDATLSATGTLRITGSASITLDNATLAATATKTGGDTLAAAVEQAKGSGGVTLRRARRRRSITGSIGWVLPRLGLSVTGEVTDPPEGEVRLLFQPVLNLRAAGAIGARGEVRFTLPEFEAIAAGFVAPCGRARLSFEPFLRSSGRHDHFNDAELALLPLLLELA
jgi:hypothetical protein